MIFIMDPSLRVAMLAVRSLGWLRSSFVITDLENPRSCDMPAISAERMQDRYDAILDAAKRAFAEKGYEGASIADIARIAQISDGLAYRYFRNKRDLLFAVLQRFYERILVDQTPFVEPLQHGKEKVPLVAEIAIGKTVGYLRDARDVGDRGALIAFFGKSTLGCIEDSVVTILHSFGAYCGHVATPRIFQIRDDETGS